MIKYIGRFRFEERSMRTCDLHTHSIYSDGTCTPRELVLMAEGLGLSAVALCDHNTADGLDELLSAAEGKNVEAVAGVELSTDYNGTELHLLALFILDVFFLVVPHLDLTERIGLMVEVQLHVQNGALALI